MIIHPQYNPVALSLGPVEVHWYGLMYLLAFAAAYGLAWYRSTKRDNWTTDMVSDLVFYGALGVILGGRIGYVLFYQFGELMQNPAYILKVWEGGMSFHGGFIGVMVGMWFFARKYKKTTFQVFDFIVPCVPTGLLFGRIGNYINGELWGRATNANYGMIFPQVDMIARHPSQLYEFALEGVALFCILWWFSRKQRPIGAISALFLIGYGSFRFLVEFTRQPDDYLGLLQLGLSMGQWLSLPMILIGIWMWFKANAQQFN